MGIKLAVDVWAKIKQNLKNKYFTILSVSDFFVKKKNQSFCKGIVV